MAPCAKTVLVVDDEEALRTLAAKLIEKRGHKVLTAADGKEALAILAGGAPVDLLVLDVVMPELNGLQTLEEVRKQWSYAELPVILLTGQAKDADVLGGYQRGADYYITKPLKPAALLNIVDYLIGDLAPDERTKLEALL
ncbi:MAG TPA: response regulator [Candidatus Margulisiibacteriota bacterium]|nr:response regulator [Candidatus Margulisiibacteriota bacterium]